MSRLFNRWLLVSFAAFLWVSCSGDGQQEAEEVVEKSEDESDEATAQGEEAAAEAEQAVNEAAPTAEEEAEAAKPAMPAAAEPPGFNGKPVSRYITSFALNVRAAPSKDAPVLKHVKWGDKVDVVVNGEWAKLAPGEFISSKHLSATPPGTAGAKKSAAPKKKGK